MEVHHHPQVEKKNFKEYFLEFLMIFLAVTLGFFAENIREHFSEQKSTREYLETFQQELQRNKNILKQEKKMLLQKIPVIDSLAIIFDEGNENKTLGKTTSLLSRAFGIFFPRIETSAYQQMINSGGLKNISNGALKDTLALYIDHIEDYKSFNQYINNQLSNTFPDVAKIMDIRAALTDDSIKNIRPFIIDNPKERRFVVFFYSDIEDQYRFAITASDEINYLNERLLNLVNHELDK
jgi:type III secretory pathway component EscV